jgi:hypothetical protein
VVSGADGIPAKESTINNITDKITGKLFIGSPSGWEWIKSYTSSYAAGWGFGFFTTEKKRKDFVLSVCSVVNLHCRMR